MDPQAVEVLAVNTPQIVGIVLIAAGVTAGFFGLIWRIFSKLIAVLENRLGELVEKIQEGNAIQIRIMGAIDAHSARSHEEHSVLTELVRTMVTLLARGTNAGTLPAFPSEKRTGTAVE